MSPTSPTLERDAKPLHGAQQPRISHVPAYASSAGQEAVELAALAGLHLDPWEALVLEHALGERPDGRWASFEVGLVVPRQNGKGAILEARELAGLFLFGEKLLIHSAHEQATSSEHFRRLLSLIEGVPEFDRRVLKAPKGKGAEAIELRGGQRILFKTRTGGGGRGLTGDFVALDEAMMLPEATTAALVPTMAARSIHGNPQLWYSGSAVDQQFNDLGVVLARVRERGLRGVDRLAYFEWSVDAESPDRVPEAIRTDPEAWAQANPGMGIRISEQHIANECDGALSPRGFAVERLGVGDWPATDGSGDGLDPVKWAAREDIDSQPIGPVCFAFDVNPERTAACIGVGGFRADGEPHIEPVEHRPGTDWVVPRLVELVGAHTCIGVKLDDKGPAGALLEEARQAMVPVEAVTVAQHAQACGQLHDRVHNGSLHWRAGADLAPVLAAAVKGARKRPLGDAWAWSRKNSGVDISPLVACTLALGGIVEAGQVTGGFSWG